MNKKTRKALIKQQRELNRLAGLKSLEENNTAIAIAASLANQNEKQKKLNEEMRAEEAILETATEEERKMIEEMRTSPAGFSNSQIGRILMALRSTKNTNRKIANMKEKLGMTAGRRKTHRRVSHKRRKTHRRS